MNYFFDGLLTQEVSIFIPHVSVCMAIRYNARLRMRRVGCFSGIWVPEEMALCIINRAGAKQRSALTSVHPETIYCHRERRRSDLPNLQWFKGLPHGFAIRNDIKTWFREEAGRFV